MSKIKRQTRARKNIALFSDRPRLSVFMSNKYMYVQVISPEGQTLFGLTEKSLGKKNLPRVEKAKELGKAIAKIAIGKKIEKVVFDKGSFAYHGKVKAVAEGAREGGLQF